MGISSAKYIEIQHERRRKRPKAKARRGEAVRKEERQKFNIYCQCYTPMKTTFFVVMVQSHKRYTEPERKGEKKLQFSRFFRSTFSSIGNEFLPEITSHWFRRSVLHLCTKRCHISEYRHSHLGDDANKNLFELSLYRCYRCQAFFETIDHKNNSETPLERRQQQPPPTE